MSSVLPRMVRDPLWTWGPRAAARPGPVTRAREPLAGRLLVTPAPRGRAVWQRWRWRRPRPKAGIQALSMLCCERCEASSPFGTRAPSAVPLGSGGQCCPVWRGTLLCAKRGARHLSLRSGLPGAGTPRGQGWRCTEPGPACGGGGEDRHRFSPARRRPAPLQLPSCSAPGAAPCLDHSPPSGRGRSAGARRWRVRKVTDLIPFSCLSCEPVWRRPDLCVSLSWL
uniref:Uncharacterized protein n=1 Tax=Rousettus aegyptiacus TaxID=9407 RepID=A0A7J8DHA4_ROUAE|nr:hypothetical protein HJG63_008464 [Rousettus aegyptiacus]